MGGGGGGGEEGKMGRWGDGEMGSQISNWLSKTALHPYSLLPAPCSLLPLSLLVIFHNYIFHN
ncbi:MAG: hypothetical protein F6K56_35850 [Moorea sp. SIO3G5]|nr:hypothetical protein [Moorena sp. SIO3G5]